MARRSRMRTLALLGLLFWTGSAALAQDWSIRLTTRDVRWGRGAGRLSANPDTMVFVTNFRVDRCDGATFDAFVNEWLARHPDARLGLIAQSPPRPEPPRAIYVWVADGLSSSLNLDLVERGICPAASMAAPRHVPLVISEWELEDLLMRARSREAIARRAEIGIWVPPPVKEEDDE